MKRSQIVLSVMASGLLVALFVVLLWQPKREEITEVRDETLAVQDQTRALEAEIERLRLVREEAAEVEADLAAATAILPQGSELPALLRQLQMAADDAGLELNSVSVGRPAEGVLDSTLAELPVTVAAEAGYYQVVDFLRRVEDPSITPRGVLWESISLAVGEYPTLAVNLTGRSFADAAVAIRPDTLEPPADEAPADGEEDDTDDADTDEELETDAETTSALGTPGGEDR
jgi:Tfp pilus assembly protein PilO